MRESLKNKLRVFIAENNPEILLRPAEGFSFSQYLDDKMLLADAMIPDLKAQGLPDYVVEEKCLDMLTIDLRPSRGNYIKAVLEEEFPQQYHIFLDAGVLRYELTNLIAHCEHVFEAFEFSEANEQDRRLRYLIIAEVQTYLQS